MRSTLFISIAFIVIQGCMPSAKMRNYDSYRFPQPVGDTIPRGKVKVTFLGTSTLLIDDGETQLMTDGFITRPGFGKVGLGKVKSNSKKVKAVIDQLKISRLKAVFCVHSHYDHVLDAPNVALQTGAMLCGSSSTLNVGRGAGLAENKLVSFHPGSEIRFGKFGVTILNSKHTKPIKVLGKSNDDLGVSIDKPLKQPAKIEAFSEGGAYDILIRHGQHYILIKASTNYLEKGLDNITADVLFLGTATLGKEDSTFKNAYYNQTVGKVKPKILVPVHWDNFMRPLNDHLSALPKLADNVKAGMTYLIQRTTADKVQLNLMQGYDSVLLF